MLKKKILPTAGKQSVSGHVFIITVFIALESAPEILSFYFESLCILLVVYRK